MFVEIENKVFDLTDPQLEALNLILSKAPAVSRKWSGDDCEYTRDYSVYKLKTSSRTEWKTVVKHEVLEKSK